jgi:hypothetical protein
VLDNVKWCVRFRADYNAFQIIDSDVTEGTTSAIRLVPKNTAVNARGYKWRIPICA